MRKSRTEIETMLNDCDVIEINLTERQNRRQVSMDYDQGNIEILS